MKKTTTIERTAIVFDRMNWNHRDQRETIEHGADRSPDDRGLKIFRNNKTGETFVGHHTQRQLVIDGKTSNSLETVTHTQSGAYPNEAKIDVFSVSAKELLSVVTQKNPRIPEDLNTAAADVLAVRERQRLEQLTV